MAVKKSASASKKAQAATYKTLCKAGKNKAAKLARHAKNHPNDIQAERAQKTALDHPGRKAPVRQKARLNPFINESDKIALFDKDASMTFANRSLNLLSGRLSSVGRRIQEALAFGRSVRNQVAYDSKGKTFPKARLTKAEQGQGKERAAAKSAKPTGKQTKKSK